MRALSTRSAQLTGLAAAVALSSLVVPAFAASAAAPMCQGKEATIVDTDGGTVEGTDGDDVIVASGPDVKVGAKSGDDLVCVEVGYVFAGPGQDSIQVRGTDGVDFVSVWDSENLDISMGGGADYLELYYSSGGSGTVDAGSGTAFLDIVVRTSIAVDLEDDTMALDSASANYVLRGFNDVWAAARQVELVGDRQDNDLRIVRVSCAMAIKGGRGHDHLEVFGNPYGLPELDCEHDPKPRLYGQRGNDKLLGRGYDDVLIGGPGRDLAKGSFGSDKCRAEREKGCER